MELHDVYPISLRDEKTKQLITISIYGQLTFDDQYLEIRLNSILVFKTLLVLVSNHGQLLELLKYNENKRITTYLKHNKIPEQ